MEVEILGMKNLFSDKKRSNKGILEFLNRKSFYLVLILGIVIVSATVVVLTKPNFKFLSFLKNTEENFIPEDFENYLSDIDEEHSEIGEGTSVDGDMVLEAGESKDDDVDAGVDVDADIDTDAHLDLEGGDGQKLVSEKSNEVQSSTFLAKNEEGSSLDRPEDKDEIEGEDKDESGGESKGNVAVIEKDGETFAEDIDNQTASGKVTQILVEDPDFIMPVYGNIIHDFAMDKLAYSKTLEDWRVHSGIDIAATRGTAVKAVADGVILELSDDPKLGNTIVIDHENGFKTVYSNLASLDMVLPNQIVAQGDSIGAVGDTGSFEIVLEPHLHFEVVKGEALVDPKLYLPQY